MAWRLPRAQRNASRALRRRCLASRAARRSRKPLCLVFLRVRSRRAAGSAWRFSRNRRLAIAGVKKKTRGNDGLKRISGGG